MRNYVDKGMDGLVDHRGKIKPEEEMTELERLRFKQRMLPGKD